VKIATWNVNSLNVRLPHVLDWLATHQPDALCLQETKLEDPKFPAAAIEAAGYKVVFSGQKTYNGVAIIARSEPVDVVMGIPGFDDPQRRVIAATVDGVRLVCAYIPNGESVDSAKYPYKLDWLARFTAWLQQEMAQHPSLAVLGDYNIAPDDRDVFDPSKFIDVTHTSPAERKLLDELCDWGLVDLFRQHYDDAKLYSWWDYRAGDFHQGRGLRIDLVLGTRAVAERAAWSIVDRNARKGTSPSDHAPVVVDLLD